MRDDSAETPTQAAGADSAAAAFRLLAAWQTLLLDRLGTGKKKTRALSDVLAGMQPAVDTFVREVEAAARGGRSLPAPWAGPVTETIIAALHVYAALIEQESARDLRLLVGSLIRDGLALDAPAALRLAGSLVVTEETAGLAERLAGARPKPATPDAGGGSP